MTEHDKKPDLQESWLTGAFSRAALLKPVIDARVVVYDGSEAYVRKLREALESVFKQWQLGRGTLPNGRSLAIARPPNFGKHLGEYPPDYMDAWGADYADLLKKLRAEQYPPLMKLEAVAEQPLRAIEGMPDNLPLLLAKEAKAATLGMQRILAALILSEAAAGNIESVAKAHWELGLIQHEIKRKNNKAMEARNEKNKVLAVKALKSVQGHKERDKDKDILAFQNEAAPLFEANGYNIAMTLREPALAAYVRKHYGAHTLRDALKKIKPEGEGPKGRPKKR